MDAALKKMSAPSASLPHAHLRRWIVLMIWVSTIASVWVLWVEEVLVKGTVIVVNNGGRCMERR